METINQLLQGILSLLLRWNSSTSTSRCLQREPCPAIFISVTRGRWLRQRPASENKIFVRFYFTLCYLMLTIFVGSMPVTHFPALFACFKRGFSSLKAVVPFLCIFTSVFVIVWKPFFLHFCSGVEAVQITAKDRYGNSADVSMVISVTIEPSGAVPDGTILPMLEHSPVHVTLNGGLAKLPRLTLCARVGNYIGDYLLVFSAPGVESYSVKFAFSTGESLTSSVSLVLVLLDKHSTKTERESIETDYWLST